ncbi:MAG: UDP-N-acetylmuramate dehydrogenase [Planctomycetota bacterium]
MKDAPRALVGQLRGVVRESVSLAPFTHLRIGGPAEVFVEALTPADVAAAVRVCREEGVRLRVLGGGSNVLIGDGGVSGVVLSLDRLQRIVRDGTRLTVEAGASLPGLLRLAREQGLAGLEVLTGVPAQLGGAVAMNAGTREGETFDLVESVSVVDPDGEIRELARDACRPRYRDGGFAGQVVLSATLALREDDPKAIRERFEAYLRYRNATQPITERSVGCVFQNPPGEAAGRLIEQAGCKLLRMGGISVSGKHANYFVNDGSGTCAEFVAMIGTVRERVFAASGIRLELEVKPWDIPELTPS